jgi:hypothetical protein
MVCPARRSVAPSSRQSHRELEGRAWTGWSSGVDPHNRSVTFGARESREILRSTSSFSTDATGYRTETYIGRITSVDTVHRARTGVNVVKRLACMSVHASSKLRMPNGR